MIQEVDITTGPRDVGVAQPRARRRQRVLFETARPPTGAYDYFHINSLVADQHGNLLISARNTWALYDDQPRTPAASLWRLGGRHSTFALGPGVPFAYQHNAQWLADGDLAVFDDEGAPPVTPPSRGERRAASTDGPQDRDARRASSCARPAR